ncbi:MAG: sugar phosphate isomerase/epimerase [Sedimentisphaerales bacterium]|nr:sugar phosphate isomerase/epimerase [Sedimentisphaerales bacterium]
MRIRYVVSTMIFWGREHHLSFEQECLFLKSLGFGIELWPNIKGHEECRYDRRNWPRLAAATQNMLVAMRSRTDNPTVEQWNEQIECAKLLNAQIVTNLESLGIPDGVEPNGSGFAAEVVELAEQNDVRLCLETGKLPTIKEIARRFESLSYCLDTGYANIDKDFTFRQYVDELAPRVAHLHLTDNYGCTDDHEPPGLHGGISRQDWDYLLEAIDRYDNDVIGSLEMCPCTPDVMIRKADEYIFDILGWPDRPKAKPGEPVVTYDPIY